MIILLLIKYLDKRPLYDNFTLYSIFRKGFYMIILLLIQYFGQRLLYNNFTLNSIFCPKVFI